MSESKVLFNIGLDMCEKREVGLLELVVDLMGYPNFLFDKAHVFIPNDANKVRLRVLVPFEKLAEEKAVHETNFLDDFYPNRCKEFGELSVYNLMTIFEIITEKADSTTRRNRPLTASKRKKTKLSDLPKKKKQTTKQPPVSDDEDDKEWCEFDKEDEDHDVQLETEKDGQWQKNLFAKRTALNQKDHI
ncbi:hypothetical protein CAEBREN_05827 [Caenorhabditis brenneri]|uniref:Uncharacterized protein n=1 Tax=Caenorhabditis brenneri TaxID=135651 RepID=G0NB91_CAEBE|nr:hypothetical protein CAEBREN_05827 [Caenorhabditis brenneri]